MTNKEKIREFCKELRVKILDLKYNRKDAFWEMRVQLPFGYKERFWGSEYLSTNDSVAYMLRDLEARIEHIYNLR